MSFVRKDALLLRDWGLQTVGVVRCAHCKWTFEGTMQDGRDAHFEHRAAKHRKPVARRKQRQRRWVTNSRQLDTHIAGARAAGAQVREDEAA